MPGIGHRESLEAQGIDRIAGEVVAGVGGGPCQDNRMRNNAELRKSDDHLLGL